MDDNYTLSYLGLEDYEEAIDFINFVFSKAHGPIDFETLLPKLYRPREDLIKNHLAVKAGGKIRSMVGLYPLEFSVCGEKLPAGGIGGVSVHHRCRGSGYMRRLMWEAISEMKARGYVFSLLGGLRQRYGYYGYENAVAEFTFNFSAINFRHCFPDGGSRFGGVEFAELKDNPEWEAFARRIQEKNRLYCARGDEFELCARSWHAKPHMVLRSGKPEGYIIVRGNKTVTEVAGISAETEFETLCAWVAVHGDTEITIGGDKPELCRLLGGVCEENKVSHSANLLVLDWERMLNAFMRLRAEISPVAGEPVTVEIEGAGKYRLSADGAAFCRALDGAAFCRALDGAADMRLTSLEAHRLFFGHLPPEYTADIPAKALPLIKSFCPLPLYWGNPDHV